MKILVLSPGEPSLINSGLGIAANELNKELKDLVDLVIIQPSSENSNELLNEQFSHIINFNKEVFREEKVVIQENKITVEAQLDPYHYNIPTSTTLTSADKHKTRLIKNELKSYSDQVLTEIEQLDFDLIYAHDWITLQAAVKIKKQSGKPFVAHIHSLDYDRGAATNKSFVYDIEYQALKKADAIIAVSQYTSDILEEHYDIARDKINVVYNAIEPIKLQKVKKTIPEKLILFVGRLSGQKGPGVFMQIAEELISKRDDVRFVMVGSGELLKDLIERGASPLSSGKMHFTGNIDHKDVLKLYAMSDVYCMPSVSEPFGLSAIEAASAGLPVVLSTQSGAAEILKGAYIADHWNVSAFTNHIDKILTNPASAKNAIALNIDSLKGLTWTNAANQVYEVFKAAID